MRNGAIMGTKVGIGFDAHRFVEGRPLILGGVEIDHPQGLAGHSDADVLSHAIADSLLGAAGLEDIGYYFPDTDPTCANISSLEIISKAVKLVMETGCNIGNIDGVIIAEEPLLAPYRNRMRESLAGALGVPPAAVSLRATTSEGMGFPGRKEGIAAMAVSLLECEIVGESQ